MYMEGEITMVKFLTQFSHKEEFFRELQENEIFMYSYRDFQWEDILAFAEQYGVEIQYIAKGTEEYKKYGECAARVINSNEKIFKFEIALEEVIEIKAKNEQSARNKLLEYLFSKGLITFIEAV